MKIFNSRNLLAANAIALTLFAGSVALAQRPRENVSGARRPNLAVDIDQRTLTLATVSQTVTTTSTYLTTQVYELDGIPQGVTPTLILTLTGLASAGLLADPPQVWHSESGVRHFNDGLRGVTKEMAV